MQNLCPINLFVMLRSYSPKKIMFMHHVYHKTIEVNYCPLCQSMFVYLDDLSNYHPVPDECILFMFLCSLEFWCPKIKLVKTVMVKSLMQCRNTDHLKLKHFIWENVYIVELWTYLNSPWNVVIGHVIMWILYICKLIWCRGISVNINTVLEKNVNFYWFVVRTDTINKLDLASI